MFVVQMDSLEYQIANRDAASVLLARRRYRGHTQALVQANLQGVLAQIEQGDDRAARRMLKDEMLEPAWRERFLDALAEREARSAYSSLGASLDPGHPEFDSIRALVREMLASDPSVRRARGDRRAAGGFDLGVRFPWELRPAAR